MTGESDGFRALSSAHNRERAELGQDPVTAKGTKGRDLFRARADAGMLVHGRAPDAQFAPYGRKPHGEEVVPQSTGDA
jgi:hypothetical protein